MIDEKTAIHSIEAVQGVIYLDCVDVVSGMPPLFLKKISSPLRSSWWWWNSGNNTWEPAAVNGMVIPAFKDPLFKEVGVNDE